MKLINEIFGLTIAGDPATLLTWGRRMKIAMGAAKGLKHLHESNIVHRNLRSSNILLTHDYEPLVKSFVIRLIMILQESCGISSRYNEIIAQLLKMLVVKASIYNGHIFSILVKASC